MSTLYLNGDFATQPINFMRKSTSLLVAGLLSATLSAPALAMDVQADSSPPPVETTAASLFKWKAMAAHEATLLAPRLSGGVWSIRIAEGHSSAFARTFHRMLVTELSARGVAISTQPSSNIIELQLDMLKAEPRQYQPGDATLVVAGLWVLKGLMDAMPLAEVATLVAAGGDLAMHQWGVPKHAAVAELAVHLVAKQQHQVVTSSTNIYLLEKRGLDAYASQPGQTLHFKR